MGWHPGLTGEESDVAGQSRHRANLTKFRGGGSALGTFCLAWPPPPKRTALHLSSLTIPQLTLSHTSSLPTTLSPASFVVQHFCLSCFVSLSGLEGVAFLVIVRVTDNSYRNLARQGLFQLHSTLIFTHSTPLHHHSSSSPPLLHLPSLIIISRLHHLSQSRS